MQNSKQPTAATSNYDPSSLNDPMDRFAHTSGPSYTTTGTAPPPRYSYVTDEKAAATSRWNPRYWRKRTWIGAAIVAIIVIIAVAVGAYEGVKESRYPDYSTLSYSLSDTYSGTDFFDNFEFFNTYDPSSGFVHYSLENQYPDMNLTYASSTSAVLRVDKTEANATTGRHSSRITSKTQYDNGLFIFDIVHTPYGCATWPALWLSDPYNWPTNGEIDVVEAVNQATSGNQMTLHTTKGCSMSDVKRKETGSVLTTNCYNGTDDNAGCGVTGPVDTYGEALNTNGGGVYAMELRDAGIRVWFFPRSDIPADITNGTSPDPESWSEALADFPSTDCDISSHFTNQSIIVDIDVCGNWAGATSTYTTKDQCPGNCTSYAAENPSAFDDAYWEFNYFKVFTSS